MHGGTAAWGLCGVLLAGAWGSLGGCYAELSTEALHEAIAGWFWQEEGIVIDSVRCPRALSQARGEAIACEVVLGGEVVEVTAEVVDDDGALAMRSRHPTVVAARAEPEIAQTLRDQGIAVARVDCDGVVWVARPGAEHRCEVTAEDGRRFAWHGVWSGEGTQQRTTVTPLAGVGEGEGVGASEGWSRP